MSYLLISVVVLGLCALVLIALKVRKKIQKTRAERQRRAELQKAQQPARDWLEKFYTLRRGHCVNEELAALDDAPDASEWSCLAGKINDAMTYVQEARSKVAMAREQARKQREELEALLAAMDNEGRSLAERFGAALSIRFSNDLRHHLKDDESRALTDYLKSNLDAYVDALLEAARDQGDRRSFLDLTKLTTGGRYSPQYWMIAERGFVTPDDWDDLVVRFDRNPNIQQFRFVNREQSPGAVRHMAARALKQRSLKEAQIALAFCNLTDSYWTSRSTKHEYWPWRDEIGDVLLAGT